MAQDTAQIRKVQDKEGTQFFPITHVDAVIDENGDAVSTLLAGKQDTLVSGTNIKTINSQSLLGSGNIVIEGGGGGGSIDSIVMNGDAVTVTGGVADLGTVITQHQDISGKADKVSSPTNGNFAGLDANGNLTDSGHKHSDYQAALVSGTNIKTVNSTSLLGSGNISVGTYSKPSDGIPKTDLASGVQTSLGLADTALQSYIETDPTVPSWAKASSKPSYTFSEIGTTPTTISGYGITDAKISNGTITLGNSTITPLTSFTETDPIFSAAPAAGIQSSDISAWNAKLSGVTFNGVAATVTGGVAAITATIPAAPGTLQTDLTTAQTASASEALSGSIKLHKIAKTGTYSDLIGTPTIPTKVSELTNDAGYTTNTGTVTRVDVGTSQYSPTSGVVSLPAYPTTLPASDVSAWAKESSKPSYTLDEVTDGSTRKLSSYLPLSAGIEAPLGNLLLIQNGSDAKIVLDNTDNDTDWSYISFRQNGTEYGSLGTKGSTNLVWGPNEILHAGNYTSYALPRSGGSSYPMTGTLYVATSLGISDASGNGLLVYHPTGWTGVTSSQWGVGAADCQGVIRSSATDLVHYRGDTAYNILDTQNFVAGTDYQTPIAANTYAPYYSSGYVKKDGDTMSGHLQFNNGTFLKGADTGGTARTLLGLDTDNGMYVGWGVAAAGYDSQYCGNNILFKTSTSHTEAMRINSSGNVGIGAASPAYKLDVRGNLGLNAAGGPKITLCSETRNANNGSIEFIDSYSTPRNGFKIESVYGGTASRQNLVFYTSDNTTSPYTASWNATMVIRYNGNVGIKKTSPEQALDVTGNIAATGTITPGSDSRIKDNQKDISAEQAFDVLENLNPKSWTWNEDAGENLVGKKAAGLVAQEVKEVLPDAVIISETDKIKDFHALNYNTVQGYEIAAIKGLIEEVKSLKAEIAELKKQIK